MATAIHTPSLHFRSGTQPAIISLPKEEFELNGFALDPRFYDDEEDYLDEYIMDLGADSESLLESESTSSLSERAAPVTPTPKFPPPPPDVPFSHADWTHSVTHVLACLSLLAVFWRLGARSVGA